ncbi:hypothetical protein ACJX0J_011523, partial [Zea mays]
DDKVVAFRDINPSAFSIKHVNYINHINTINIYMVKVGENLLNQDAPNSEEHRYCQIPKWIIYGFFCRTVDHLHLHFLALPFMR